MKVLTADSYQKVRSLVYEKAGINLGENRQALVESRLQKRLKQMSLNNVGEYLDYLQKDKTGQELVQLLDAISTNFTYFFREVEHFEILKKFLITSDSTNKSKRLRIWCGASSTGEEPYTLAMTVNEVLGNKGYDAKILATDISTRVLEVAHRGYYEADKLKPLNDAQIKMFWHKDKDHDGYWADQSLKSMLNFARLNLMETPYPMKGPFDVVFLRNVMIYFDNAGRTKILNEIAKLLRPNGLLFLGHSESMQNRVEGLITVGPSVYQKV